MAKLNFNPLPVFKPAYNMDKESFRAERSFFKPEYRYFVDYGGRGGGKTMDKVRSVLLEATIRKVRVLVTRELQNSISESIKAEIEFAIEDLEISHFFTITKTEIKAANGSLFIFRGLKNNINNLKSIADVDIVIVEEAENVTQVSWDKLLPSIRPKSGRAIVIVIFNPASELDATWQTWIVDTPKKTLITKCNYYDNKYFPESLDDLRKDHKRTKPPKVYDNIWLGIPAGSEGDIIIDQDWIRAARFASNNPDFVKSGPKRVAYDPAGQGRDANAVVYADGNCIKEVDEWVKSPDLREATRRALSMVRKHKAESFSYDECGGFGDGVAVFVSDNVDGSDGAEYPKIHNLEVIPFNAGDPVLTPKFEEIEGTDKLPSEIYCNQKAHAHGVLAQMFYNTYRFIELGERDIEPEDMISLDIDDDDLFKKLMREMSAALWVKSENNSKKKVESKKDMKKRTGTESPNINDSIVMLVAPKEQAQSAGGWDW